MRLTALPACEGDGSRENVCKVTKEESSYKDLDQESNNRSGEQRRTNVKMERFIQEGVESSPERNSVPGDYLRLKFSGFKSRGSRVFLSLGLYLETMEMLTLKLSANGSTRTP